METDGNLRQQTRDEPSLAKRTRTVSRLSGSVDQVGAEERIS